MTCPECSGKLGVKATRCRCGWVMPGTAREFGTPMRAPIQCCFSGCIEGAIVSMQTPTGRANVCRTHYPKVERDYRPGVLSEQEIACRSAYLKSPHYRMVKDGLTSLPSDMVPVREPGEDAEETVYQEPEKYSQSEQKADPVNQPALGIPLDPLEVEFQNAQADRAEP